MVFGLLIAGTSGIAFNATLKQAVQAWAKNRSTRTLANLKGPQLLIPFLGISLGIGFFLSAGLQIFGFPDKLAIGSAVPLTIFTSWLVWWQLGKILIQLERGGSQAIDLDSWG
ncbi:hypothetical protein H6G89_02665 [Oscillatoria sp. FACHB-1407]|nr:hypothetical protein [Oscillatoria sp. FACHB-1407]MBD2459938.1 hypothetical protein [Oscillatoria sp. FACHB-1407]